MASQDWAPFVVSAQIEAVLCIYERCIRSDAPHSLTCQLLFELAPIN